MKRRLSKQRIQILLGILLSVGLSIQGYQLLTAEVEGLPPAAEVTPAKVRPSQAFATPVPSTPAAAESLEAFAARDPIGFFDMLLDRYDRSVRDYTCTFTKHELIGGRLSSLQTMEAMFRESPFSLRLTWIKNADKCSRVLYVAGQWIKNGQQMAVVEPGAIARLIVPYVMRPIHGTDARKSSRRTMDQFGLQNSLALTAKFSKLAREQNLEALAFVGHGKVKDRETLVFERHLPYTGEEGVWPDRVLVVHIDKELLLPVLCQAYADDDKAVLLGHYQMSDIKLNVNLPDSTFTKEGMGL